jgi:hypothetical protein
MLRKTLATTALLLTSALAFAEPPQVSLGSFRPGERVSPPEAHAPARTSRALVTTVAADGQARIVVPATGGGRLLLWVQAVSQTKADGVAVSLTMPSGRTLTAGESASADRTLRRFALESAEPGEMGLDLPGAKEAFEVKAAEAGVYTVEVKTEGQAAVTVVAAEPESALTLEAWAGPLSRRPGEPVQFHAELRDGKAGLAGARVIAQLVAPGDKTGRALRLFDDGQHDDGAPNDGVYAGALADLDGPSGPWSVRFDASGRDARGQAFARTNSSGFMSESPATRLLARFTQARLVGEGAERHLQVTTAARSQSGGLFRLEVIVAGAAAEDGSRPGIAWAESTTRLAAGRTPLSVEMPASLLAGADGALYLDIRLLGLDSIGLAGRTTLEVLAER